MIDVRADPLGSQTIWKSFDVIPLGTWFYEDTEKLCLYQKIAAQGYLFFPFGRSQGPGLRIVGSNDGGCVRALSQRVVLADVTILHRKATQ